MTESALSEDRSQIDVEQQEGLISGIPVKNIWFFMYYASDLFRHARNSRNQIEDIEDQIVELIGYILITKVEQRIKLGLSVDYNKKIEILSRVRGKINLLYTEKKQLFRRGKVCCEFHDLNVDTVRNRYIKGALETLSKLTNDTYLIKQSKFLAHTLKIMGVLGDPPYNKETYTERVGRHDLPDKGMLDAAYLIYNVSLLNEEEGRKNFFSPDRSEAFIKELFLKAIKAFYQKIFVDKGWIVEVDREFPWPIDYEKSSTACLVCDIPSDIVLNHEQKNESLVITVKFNALFGDDGKISEADLYPIYTLLKTQSELGVLKRKTRGVILRPMVGVTRNEVLVIQGQEIQLYHLDLTASAYQIRHQLMSLVTYK